MRFVRTVRGMSLHNIARSIYVASPNFDIVNMISTFLFVIDPCENILRRKILPFLSLDAGVKCDVMYDAKCPC